MAAKEREPIVPAELTVRDHFAVAALRALLTSEIRGFAPPSLSDPDSYRVFALEAYRMADAMIEIRKLMVLPPK